MDGMTLYFATSNKHKVEEARTILGAGKEGAGKAGAGKAGAGQIEVEQVEIDYPEVRSDSTDEVAKDGVEYVFRQFKKPVFVEDSGLFIEGLGGFPGTYSAYVFKKVGCEGILRLLEGKQNRSARFISSIAYLEPESEVHVFTGTVSGSISHEMRGSGGFGYDPVVIPEGHESTFAELGEEKNRISHRFLALQKFREYLDGRK